MVDEGAGSRSDGFTLLELLLAMAITTIVIVLIFGSFRIGIRAWERGERDIDHRQRVRTALELMTRQMDALCRAGGWTKSGQPVAFEGKEGRLSFVSQMALHLGRRIGVVYVRYVVEVSEEGVDLYVTEGPVTTLTEPLDVDAPDPNGRHKLMSGMHSVTFQYLTGLTPEGDPNWTKEWDPLVMQGWPVAVRILVVDRPMQGSLGVLIPIRAQEES
ncbi:MAG: prepilin-type N-terminal cleavage/methylation domain-containing protein [Deltaproteobacteria bacterium]|nr:prepilin-type N-terminal cleavage/methylation domain-containing protein [Deltaproteobacteria bacterium]